MPAHPEINPALVVEARLQTHFAVEWISRIGRFAADPRNDYSHIALSWVEGPNVLATVPLPGRHSNKRAAVSIANFKLVMLDGDKIDCELELNGRTHAEVGKQAEGMLNDLGLDGAAIHQPIPYTLSHPQLSSGGKYDGSAMRTELGVLQGWFHTGDAILGAVKQRWSGTTPGPSPVLCWPHHFDMATLVTLEPGDPKQARSIGFGMSPGDETHPHPYYYINPWPHPPNFDTLPPPPVGMEWHTDGYFSLLVHAAHLLAAPNPPERASQCLQAGGDVAAKLLNFTP